MKKLRIFQLASPTGVPSSNDYVLREDIVDRNKMYSENSIQAEIEKKQKEYGGRYVAIEVYEP